MPATLTDPEARPFDAPPCALKRPGRYVFDQLAAHEAGGPLPPFVAFAAITDGGAVLLDVQPEAGPARYVRVPDGGSAELPGCPGWSAHCRGLDEAGRVAWVWLTHDGRKPAPPAREYSPSCPF